MVSNSPFPSCAFKKFILTALTAFKKLFEATQRNVKKKISVNFFASPGIGKGRVNPFVPNVPFLYTHKISENLTWRIGKECIVNKWVNKNHLQYSSEVNISIFYLLISFRSCFTPLQKIIEIPQVWGVCWGFPHSTKTNFIFKANNKEHLNKSLDAFWGFSCYL